MAGGNGCRSHRAPARRTASPRWSGRGPISGDGRRRAAGRRSMLGGWPWSMAAAQWPAGLGQHDASGQAPRNGDHSDQDSRRHGGLRCCGSDGGRRRRGRPGVVVVVVDGQESCRGPEQTACLWARMQPAHGGETARAETLGVKGTQHEGDVGARPCPPHLCLTRAGECPGGEALSKNPNPNPEPTLNAPPSTGQGRGEGRLPSFARLPFFGAPRSRLRAGPERARLMSDAAGAGAAAVAASGSASWGVALPMPGTFRACEPSRSRELCFITTQRPQAMPAHPPPPPLPPTIVQPASSASAPAIAIAPSPPSRPGLSLASHDARQRP